MDLTNSTNSAKTRFAPWGRSIPTRPLDVPVNFKNCRSCKGWKARYEFVKDLRKKQGIGSICSSCKNKQANEYKAVLSPNKRLMHRYSAMKSISKRKNLKSDITFEMYRELIKPQCFYCDGVFGRVTQSIGLDRIDNTLGYEQKNVLSCCNICNRTRNSHFSVQETRAMIQLVIAMRLKQGEKNNG